MRFFPVYVALLLLAITVPGCTQAVEEEVEIDKAVQEEAAMKAFNEMSEQWSAAANAGDVDAIAALLTDDCIRMNPDIPILEGKEAAVGRLRAFHKENDVQDHKLVIVEVRLAGDWAYVRGTVTSVVTPKTTGEPMTRSSKWVEIRELQPDGSWKISRTIHNRSAPLPVAPE